MTVKASYPNVVTNSGIARIMAQTLEDFGCDSHQVFAKAGLDLADIYKSETRVSSLSMQNIWRKAVEVTGEQSFGLSFAKNLHPAALQGLGFAWIASNSLRDAFDRLVRYYRLISSGGEIILEEDLTRVSLWYKIPRGGTPAVASLDAALAVFIQLCRFTKGEHFCSEAVSLQRSQPDDISAYEAFFRCPVTFAADENTLTFNKVELEAALPMANAELARANDQVVIDYLKRNDRGNIINEVRACIIELLPSGSSSQRQVASHVNQSTRSLQRKLSEHGTTYKSLFDEIRKDLALQYLQESNRTISEVTYLLGFTEPSNFTRSFKRWTGITPHEYQSR